MKKLHLIAFTILSLFSFPMQAQKLLPAEQEKIPKETQIINVILLDSEKMKVTETARNEYNVGVPKQDFQEPFVIKLEIKSSKTSTNKYHEALT